MAVAVGVDYKPPFLNLLAEHSNPRLYCSKLGNTQIKKTKNKQKQTQTLHPACYTTLSLYHNLLQFTNEDSLSK